MFISAVLTAEQSEQADLAGQVEVHDEVLDELRDEEKTKLGRILNGTRQKNC